MIFCNRKDIKMCKSITKKGTVCKNKGDPCHVHLSTQDIFNVFQADNLVPTTHIHHDLIDESIKQKMFKIIDDSDIVFFESIGNSFRQKIDIENEKFIKDIYSED